MEGFVQIVLINCFQNRLLDEDPIKVRTYLQYLICIIDSLDLHQFSSVTLAFLSNSLNSNFEKYLSERLINMLSVDTLETKDLVSRQRFTT